VNWFRFRVCGWPNHPADLSVIQRIARVTRTSPVGEVLVDAHIVCEGVFAKTVGVVTRSISAQALVPCGGIGDANSADSL